MSRLQQRKKGARKRIINEYKRLLKAGQDVGVMAEPNPSDIAYWNATMLGYVTKEINSVDHLPFLVNFVDPSMVESPLS